MNARAARATARVEAQAKLNLFLRVGPREPSGYHELETLFQRISLADTVTVRTGVPGRTLDCRGADAGPMESNLAWRAALAFSAACGWPDCFAIEIQKRIPVGGGLGGGSADAAAVLRALNAIAPRTLKAEALSLLALGLGADVPYLVSELPLALGRGRGERLFGFDPLPPRDVILLIPPFGVSSAGAFAAWDTAHTAPSPAPPALLTSQSHLDWNTVAKCAANDLEEPVFAQHPEIAALQRALAKAGAQIAHMTGSGSTAFGLFEPGTALAQSLGIDARTLGVTMIRATTVERVAAVELI
ncbi:MAG TPA: 4-(cytidine 5'-diphospho)-2-C-methyl-D-erythritol kinase [Gemmatimonadaceae bacterium]|nr:4-(cytidine 5'-diphospho)-2-C-methyl-D-erythritol kinase [Gemmatimonadaceae bacterium]